MDRIVGVIYHFSARMGERYSVVPPEKAHVVLSRITKLCNCHSRLVLLEKGTREEWLCEGVSQSDI
jgi:hypothetical protein